MLTLRDKEFLKLIGLFLCVTSWCNVLVCRQPCDALAANSTTAASASLTDGACSFVRLQHKVGHDRFLPHAFHFFVVILRCCQYPDCTAQNGRIIWSIIGKGLKGNGNELIKVLSYHLLEGTEENHDKRQP
jgi:hypothetical protein